MAAATVQPQMGAGFFPASIAAQDTEVTQWHWAVVVIATAPRSLSDEQEWTSGSELRAQQMKRTIVILWRSAASRIGIKEPRLLGIQTWVGARATEESCNVRVLLRDLPMVTASQEAAFTDVKLHEPSRLLNRNRKQPNVGLYLPLGGPHMGRKEWNPVM